jgi:hypothetical protein
MLIPLTRKKFEQLIPLVATAGQYRYYWGKVSDFLKRLLISVVSVLVIYVLGKLLGEGFGTLTFLIGLSAGLYWLWGPIYLASFRNLEYRKYTYSGFWQGEVLDVFITEELIGKEKTVNNRGELVIIENRERRLNLEVGDETGFRSKLQVPLRREHQVIAPGQVAAMIVLSNQADLSRITRVSDIYISSHNLWVSDYPYLRRDTFVEVSRRLRKSSDYGDGGRRSPRRSSKRSRQQASMDRDW